MILVTIISLLIVAEFASAGVEKKILTPGDGMHIIIVSYFIYMTCKYYSEFYYNPGGVKYLNLFKILKCIERDRCSYTTLTWLNTLIYLNRVYSFLSSLLRFSKILAILRTFMFYLIRLINRK